MAAATPPDTKRRLMVNSCPTCPPCHGSPQEQIFARDLGLQLEGFETNTLVHTHPVTPQPHQTILGRVLRALARLFVGYDC
ncbi:MAG: hypothetical protein A2289_16680 [Deltaproteobacteria bacterium RIFOXYA12_FULL_58_15]|nr:MAG: hypothetical protein A2289_16680 [Deltaproteobacteria bacterium RIFOXYA12_FULL_58_15]